MNIVDLVREDFGISGSGRWYRSDVHSSLVVDSERQLFFFNTRDLHGTALDYLIKVRGVSKAVATEMVRNPTADMPDEIKHSGLQTRFDKLVNLFHSSGRNDRGYWYERCLTDQTIDRYRLGNYDGWNLIPVYDNGLFINFQCRKDKPEKRIRFWYKDPDFKPVLFNSDVLPFIDTVYITEGMVDCILLNQLGLPSVCSTNGAMSWNTGWIKHFTKLKHIFYIADNDKAGVSAALRTYNVLGGNMKIMRFKDKKEKYGSMNFFQEGGTVDDFKHIVNTESVFGFEKELI